MALSGSASSPSGYQSVDDAAALLAEVADEEHVLEEFYSFMYEDAVLVGAHPANPRTDGGDCSRSPTRAFSPKRGEGSPRKNLISEPPATSLAATAPLAAPSTLTREILNAMLPPKSWRDSTGSWQRMVKMTPATRGEVVRLEDTFSNLLVDHQARAKAICHVREKFFLQVFGACLPIARTRFGFTLNLLVLLCVRVFRSEELIREVTCECPERGLLLLRVRDELRLSIEAYQTLYHNSISYGRKKAVQAEAGIAELEADIQRLERRREALQATKNELTHNALVCAARHPFTLDCTRHFGMLSNDVFCSNKIAQFLEERAEEERRKRVTRQHQTLQFLQTQRVELETFYRELMQDTTWK